jgi:hypothetical protein
MLLLYPRPHPRGSTPTSESVWNDSDRPLLDLTDAAVRRMIKLAKKRGYITFDELDQILPPEEFSAEQIDDVINQLCEMNIDLVEPRTRRSTARQLRGGRGAKTSRLCLWPSM